MESHKKKHKKKKFYPVGMILSVNENISLGKSGVIRFSNGMVEGEGISINTSGDTLSFEEDGSYRFEISGEAVSYTENPVKLVYYSEKFKDEIAQFSEVVVPKEGNKLILRGIPTMLPMKSGQKIVVKILSKEEVIVLGGTRLLIHRIV